MSPRTVSKTRSTTISPATKAPVDIPEEHSILNPVNSWEFKVTGRGTSGWMSWVKEKGKWAPLRQSETSFVSAVAAIEPEIMRLAFPHHTGRKK